MFSKRDTCHDRKLHGAPFNLLVDSGSATMPTQTKPTHLLAARTPVHEDGGRDHDALKWLSLCKRRGPSLSRPGCCEGNVMAWYLCATCRWLPFLLVLSACNSTRLTRLLMPVHSETQGILRVKNVVSVRQEKQPKIVLRIGHGSLKVRSSWLSCMIYQHVDVTKCQTTKDSHHGH